MSPRTPTLVVLVGFGLSAFASPAFSQPPPDAVCLEDLAACGKKAFDQGVEAFQKGDYPTALERFRAALAFRPHPVVAFNLALAESKTGLIVDAAARLDQILQDPQVTDQIRQNATRERDTIVRGLATVTIDSTGSGTVRATVDNTTLVGSPPSARVMPGSHRVRVEVDGQLVIDRAIDLIPGDRLRLAVTRDREVAVVMPPRAPKQPPKPDPVPASGGVHPLWFYGGVGVTAVLGGLTVWSALDTQAAFDEYENAFPTLDQDEINRRVNEGHDKELRTNLLLGGTAISATGTAVLGLFGVQWSRPGEAAAVSFGPGSVVVRGRF